MFIIKVPKGEEKEAGNSSREKCLKTSQIWGKEIDIQTHKAQDIPNRLNLMKYTLRHVIIKLSKFKDKENFEHSKRKVTSHMQGNYLKAISKLLKKYLAGQKKVRHYFQKLKQTNKNFQEKKLSFRNTGERNNFQTKTEKVHQRYICIARNATGSFSSGNKRILTNIKAYKSINLTGKCKYTDNYGKCKTAMAVCQSFFKPLIKDNNIKSKQ